MNLFENMEKPETIGGYFELELAQGEQFHKGAIALNSGRSCLKYLIKSRGITRIHLPYYICDAVTEVLTASEVVIKYYHINKNLEPVSLPEIKSTGEYVLYVDYFALMNKTVQRLARIYSSRLIVDNSQAFYSLPIRGIDTFYSPRKFFGVPDGGYLYTDGKLLAIEDQSFSYDRMSHLAKRIDLSPEAGFNDYQENEKKFGRSTIAQMSKLTEKLLSSIDYKRVESRRKKNFKILHQAFKDQNILSLRLGKCAVPMVYPLLLDRRIDRTKLYESGLYTAQYWHSVLDATGIGTIERDIVEKTIFLPVDQRYSSDDIREIIRRVSLL
jgi:hypothetical protein